MFADVRKSGLTLRLVRGWSDLVPGLVHGFTDRKGGVSEPPFHELNVAFHVGDDPDAVGENRARMCRAWGGTPDDLVAAEQVHGAKVALVDRSHRGRGAWRAEDAVPGADGLVTSDRDVLLIAFFADCVPILLLDPDEPAVGVVHAGWRGTVAGAAEAGVKAMVGAFRSRPERMYAAIGPAVGPCCYVTGEDVAEQVRRALGSEGSVVVRRGGRPFVHLPEANRRLLVRAGLADARVAVEGTCTRCRPERFFSHRGDRGRTGRFAAVIGLREGKDRIPPAG